MIVFLIFVRVIAIIAMAVSIYAYTTGEVLEAIYLLGWAVANQLTYLISRNDGDI